MILDQTEVQKCRSALSSAQRILTICHKSPDGDTVGAALAWRFALTAMGKEVVSFCVDEMPDKYDFLPGIEAFTTEIGDLNSYHLIIVNDHGHPKLTGLDPALNDSVMNSGKVLNIDHHPTNTSFGVINFVFPDAASVTQVIYFLFKALHIPITQPIATCLMNGLYTDTGSFMHDNVTPETLRVASELTRFGARAQDVAKFNFRSKPVSTLKLWGRVLERLKKNDQNVTSSAATAEDFDLCEADYAELEGVVDFLNAVPETRFSVLLSERGDVVKGSLRTPRDDIDLTEVASIFGGGGHKKASGFAVPGKLAREGDRWHIVD